MAGRRRACSLFGALVLSFVLGLPIGATAKLRPITGELSHRGYMVIALAESGRARTDRAPDGTFLLRPTARTVTLQLRAYDGSYSGPVVVGTRKRGRRALVGVRNGAHLGLVVIKPDKGYARVSRAPRKGAVDSRFEARARNGVPIGAGNFGRARSKPPKPAPAGDRDFDGVPDQLDIDDDGDLVLDNLDRATRAHASQWWKTGSFFLSATLGLDLVTAVNANAPGLSREQIESALPTSGVLGIGILPGGVDPDVVPAEAEAELDCGDPDTGLAYCRKNGSTGTIAHDPPGSPPSTWPPFPACCDADGDGWGTLRPNPTLPSPGLFLHHGATRSEIGSGDVLIQRISGSANAQFTATVQYVFETVPALVSYDDGQGHSATLTYPVLGPPVSAPGVYPLPVAAGPSGDVIVTLTFWRPQRTAIPPEPGGWTDIGGLNYTVGAANTGQVCNQDVFSTGDPNLTPVDPTPQPGGGGLRDGAVDGPASPANTLTYTLNMTRCLASNGLSFNQGEFRNLEFKAMSPNVDSSDIASVRVFFKRQ